MLHVTNGDSVSLRESGVEGDVLVWADPLHEGPVPDAAGLDELTVVRAEYIAARFGLPAPDVLRQLRQRDARIRRWRDDNEIVLWFEHDLFDQLQLLQILDYFDCESDATGRVSLVQANDYLGPMTPEQLAALYPTRQLVLPDQFKFASDAWGAFRASDPTALAGFAVRAELPYVAPAFRRHLEEFPARSNGLGRTQRQILEVLAAADSDVRFHDAFVTFQRMEDPVFLGDSSFYAEVRALANCATPVLSVEADVAAITDAGRDVLTGARDFVDLNEIDRWLGGVHLTPDNVWRWDGERVDR